MSGNDVVLGLFPSDARIELVFYKLLTGNDDSGRHGVLIPSAAYGFFPEFPGFDPGSEMNYTMPITTIWHGPSGWESVQSAWKHYHRYPERRITSLYPAAVNVDDPIRLLVIGRAEGPRRYYCTVLNRADPRLDDVLQSLRIEPRLVIPGLAAGVTEAREPEAQDRPIDILTTKLVDIAKKGYVPTLRPGDTGIGYTLETLLGIQANSSLAPDFMGIELKAGRSKLPAARRGPSGERMTLLAKTPEWGALGDRVGLLDRHGYWDKDGRWSLYMSIYAGRPNPQGWALVQEPGVSRLSAARDGVEQVWWTHAALEARLKEKHRESAFVTAHAKTIDGVEHFWFDSMVYGRQAGIEQFIGLVESRAISHDFAIHRSEGGGVRDHGFLFRIAKGDIPRLFALTEVKRLV